MNSYSEWFRGHLTTSADGFIWGTKQVPEERRNIQPPKGLGEWTVARHVFHLWHYEKNIALPSMKQWLGGSIPNLDDEDEDADWSKSQELLDILLANFRNVREEQINLLHELDDNVWNVTREAVWGPVTLLWVVSKTYQHTAEHINDVMRIGLFWDAYLAG